MENDYVSKADCLSRTTSMADDIKDIKCSVADLRVDVASLPEKIIEKTDKKYANKKTEENMDKIFWLVISSVILSILTSIFN